MTLEIDLCQLSSMVEFMPFAFKRVAGLHLRERQACLYASSRLVCEQQACLYASRNHALECTGVGWSLVSTGAFGACLFLIERGLYV